MMSTASCPTGSDASRSPRRHSREFTHRVIDGLLTDESTLSDVAGSLGVTLIDLAEWIERPGVRELLSRLARLADVRAHLLLSRCRATAALRLVAIATSDKPTDVSRKACLDLLNMNLDALAMSPPPPEVSPKATTPSEATILAALESMGKEHDDP